MQENLLLGLANIKCTEQFVYPRSQISAFGICKLGNFHTSENSIFLSGLCSGARCFGFQLGGNWERSGSVVECLTRD